MTVSNAISVGCTSSANRTPHSANTSRIGFQRSANSWKPAASIDSGTGAVTVNAGTLQMGHAQALGATGNNLNVVGINGKMNELQAALGLPEAAQRIECFDVSHTQGTDKVASMVHL